jgi:pimeloyl-ACP methyl ester carboxylesterase
MRAIRRSLPKWSRVASPRRSRPPDVRAGMSPPKPTPSPFRMSDTHAEAAIQREPAPGLTSTEKIEMRKLKTLFLSATLLGLGSSPSAASEPVPAWRVDEPVLEPCTLEGVLPPIECGTYQVLEDRGDVGGRRIGLKIIRLGPTGSMHVADPLFIVLGGPGSSATASAAGLARQFAAVRTQRPLVLVDQRGTGGSNPLECDLYPGDGVARLVGDLFPSEIVRACLTKLHGLADLRQYSTVRAVEDLEEVRRALGYDRINLYGVSYGTRVVLDFLRRYPESVRSAVLHGVTGPGQLGRYTRSISAQRALDGVLEECLASEGCRSAFPAIREQARTVFDRLDRQPQAVQVLDPAAAKPVQIELDSDLAAEAIRYMLYSGRTAGLVPLVLNEAERGNFEAIAEFAVFGRQHIINGGGNGLYLSVICSEDLAVGDPSIAGDRARGTFWSEYTYRQLRAVCAYWPRADVPASFHATVTFAGPALVVTGEWDPATPPAQGDEAAAGLPRSTHIVVPHGGHDFEGLTNDTCVYEVVGRFLQHPDPDELDTACIATIERPPFHTEPLPMRPVPVEPNSLARLQGRYIDEEIGLSLLAAVEDEQLRLLLPNGPTFPLAAVAPNRFRTPGLLGTYFRFEADPVGVHSLILEQPGSRPLRLARRDGQF